MTVSLTFNVYKILVSSLIFISMGIVVVRMCCRKMLLHKVLVKPIFSLVLSAPSLS